MNEAVNEEIKKFDDQTAKIIAYFKDELLNIRAGRVSPTILERVIVDYYGTPTPVTQMSNVNVQDARTLAISLWDISMLKNVLKALRESDLGVNPVDDGKIIRLNFPQLTEERRKELNKQVKKMGDDAKVSLRNCRRDTLEKVKRIKKDNSLSEDEVSEAEDVVQKKLDTLVANVDKIVKDKEAAILEV